jgi:16S rRNA processing protein RimM
VAERTGPDPVAVATIGKPRGLWGDCRVYAAGNTLQRVKCPLRVEVGEVAGERQPMTIAAVRVAKDGITCRFEGVNTREEAATLTNRKILLDRSELPSLGDREYYHFELEGMRVCDGERELGVVRRVENYPTMDALEVAWHNGRTVLVPMSKAVLRRIDREAGRIDVDSSALDEIG